MLIPYPDVPVMLGVPNVPRLSVFSVEAGISDLGTGLSITGGIVNQTILQADLSSANSVIANSSQTAPQWGIFDASNAQLGENSGDGTVLSTFSFDYIKETRVSDFPIERGSFASYNKVEMPSNPRVTMIMDGSLEYRKAYLAALDIACKSTALYNVVTPEAIYEKVNLERYTYSRRADKGANVFAVEVSLKEIRTATPGTTTATVPINNPQNTAATPSVNGGIVQAPVSSLDKVIQWGSNLYHSMFGGGT
jgi:hypothetical protein